VVTVAVVVVLATVTAVVLATVLLLAESQCPAGGQARGVLLCETSPCGLCKTTRTTTGILGVAIVVAPLDPAVALGIVLAETAEVLQLLRESVDLVGSAVQLALPVVAPIGVTTLGKVLTEVAQTL